MLPLSFVHILFWSLLLKEYISVSFSFCSYALATNFFLASFISSCIPVLYIKVILYGSLLPFSSKPPTMAFSTILSKTTLSNSSRIGLFIIFFLNSLILLEILSFSSNCFLRYFNSFFLFNKVVFNNLSFSS